MQLNSESLQTLMSWKCLHKNNGQRATWGKADCQMLLVLKEACARAEFI